MAENAKVRRAPDADEELGYFGYSKTSPELMRLLTPNPAVAEFIKLLETTPEAGFIRRMAGRAAACPAGVASRNPSATKAISNVKTSTSPNQARAAVRRQWMEKRHPGWSLLDWAAHIHSTYKTVRKFPIGITTRRTLELRAKLARAEKVKLSTIPE